MRIHLNAKIAYQYLRLSATLMATWPLSDATKKYRNVFYNMLWWLYLTNHLIILYLTLNTIITHNKNHLTVFYTWLEISFMTENIIVLVSYKLQETKWKQLLYTSKMTINRTEDNIRLENSDLYPKVFATLFIFFIVIIISYVNKAETYERGLIMTTRYPFEIKSIGLKLFLNLSQFITLLHASSILITDAIVVLLLYTCTIRLKIVEQKFRACKYYRHLKLHIYEHQKTLLLIEDTNLLVSKTVLKSIASFMSYSIGGGLVLYNKNTSPLQLVQICLVICVIYLRVYVCAEIAEKMISANESIGFTIYFTKWYEESAKDINAKNIIIQRCQKLPRIYINGFMQSLNRNYVRMITYATFSYFMTIRKIINKTANCVDC
ncbi:odorant receptor 51 [Nasonia vitripennis]|uniref:Odorant receptor n=1 Tax=Nasonia vitripennis TaxID=7425 RepID=A0A7M6UPK8_NASVI|nr:odorant receptor 51 [Nasonia vitripennis]